MSFRNPDYAFSNFFKAQFQRLTERAKHPLSCGNINPYLPCQQGIGRNPAEYHVRVGDRRLGPTITVASWPRMSASALRAHPQGATCVDPRYRPTPCPNGMDRYARHQTRVSSDVAAETQLRLTILNSTHIRRGPTHVKSDHSRIA